MKKKFSMNNIKRAILFWESVIQRYSNINKVFEKRIENGLKKVCEVVSVNQINGASIFTVVKDWHSCHRKVYDLVCTIYDDVINATLPDEEEFEVLRIQVYEIEESKYGPYDNKKTLVKMIESNTENLNVEKFARKALGYNF